MSTPSNGSTLNTAGSADLSFGNSTPKNGTVIYDTTTGISCALNDGSTITAGLFTYQGNRFIGITKHTPTGEEDTRFGFWSTPAEEREVLIDLITQTDNKPLLLAARLDGEAALITRFNAENGDVDKSFNASGQVRLDQRINVGLNSNAGLALQADNHILCALNDGTDGYIYQISPSGEVVNFSKDGPPKTQNIRLNTVLTTDNGFLVGGIGNRKAYVIGLDEKGDIASGFGSNGFVVMELTGDDENQVSALGVGKNGRIAVVGGNHRLPRKMDFVTLLLADGRPDEEFNGGVPLEVLESTHGHYTSVVVQSDHKVVVLAGNINGSLVKLIRYTVQGVRDLDFGDQGIAVAWRDPQSRPLQSSINKLQLVQTEEELQSSGILEGQQSFIGRLLSR